MIIVKLMGGLGNQLFQYALGRRLAMDRTVPLRLDISWFEKQSVRSFRLDGYKIDAEIASEDEIKKVTCSDLGGFQRRFFQTIQYRIPYYFRRVVMEMNPEFDPRIVKFSGKSVYLSGYWQSEKYFAGISEQIHQEIQLRLPLSTDYQQWLNKIKLYQSCSIHVRRGDYANNSQTNQVHGVCSPDYFDRAIKTILNRYSSVHFYVFSDDLNWAHENIKTKAIIEFVKLEGSYCDLEELLLMSSCEHNIIANSSYSWWAAWLNNKPDKMVIAPNTWFAIPSLENKDLIPDGWIKI